MVGELVFSLFQMVMSAVPLRVAYGLAGLIVGVLLGLILGG